MLKGNAASEGIGIGRAVLVEQQRINYEARTTEAPDREKKRLERAIKDFICNTEALAEKLEQSLNTRDTEIIRGHITMISDPFMLEEMNGIIDNGKCAEAAVEGVLELYKGMFLSAEDEYTRQRAADIEDIKHNLLVSLLGMEQMDLKHLPEDTVLVVRDLTPSMTAELDHKNVSGIVTENGGMTSHSAILSRALGLPAVLSVPGALESISDGQTVIVDGSGGMVFPDPTDEILAEYRARQGELQQAKALLKEFYGKATVTADGKPCQVFCNIGSPAEAASAAEQDCEGVGLFRTEFLFMDRESFPDEETQYQAYRKICKDLGEQTVIIRTLDVGGDKDISYLHLEREENPFLGCRAVRYCLKNPEAFRVQLKALVRASADAGGRLWIMIPLVTTITEIQTVRTMTEEICQEYDLPMPKIGTMIETPAALLVADILAGCCDFFSIGTNDLIQYIMAADRGNQDVAYLYQAHDPAVLRGLRSILIAGKQAGIPVGMCGEAAADPLLIPIWLGFGLEEFSVAPTAVLKTRREISRWTLAEAHACAEHALTLKTAKEVQSYLNEIKKP